MTFFLNLHFECDARRTAFIVGDLCDCYSGVMTFDKILLCYFDGFFCNFCTLLDLMLEEVVFFEILYNCYGF